MATGSVDLGVRGLHEVEMIGAGGSAIVYKAARAAPGHPAAEEIVAVKVLRSAWDATARRRFDREQRVMDHLAETAGFVPIIETGETADGSPYIVMPYYRGGSLQQRIRHHGPIGWPRAVRLVEEVAETLVEAHQLDVFHRDIKPANILLSENGKPHIADFGISLIADDTASQATSTAAFTPAYSPPESFIDGLMPVATTDVYGLAATLWALLAGHAPFKEPGERPTPVTVFGRVALQQVGDLREGVPSPICRFIERAMAKQPEDRPQSMNEFLTEIRAGREDAYRGVEAERLEIEPFLDEATVARMNTRASGRVFVSESDVTDETAALPLEFDELHDLAASGGPPPPVGSSNEGDKVSAVTGSVVVGEVDDAPTAAGTPAPGRLDTETAPIFALSPGRQRSDLGWLGKMVVAAVITVLILLLGWWILRPDGNSGAGTGLIGPTNGILATGTSQVFSSMC